MVFLRSSRNLSVELREIPILKGKMIKLQVIWEWGRTLIVVMSCLFFKKIDFHESSRCVEVGAGVELST